MKTAELKRRIIRFNTYAPYPNARTGRQALGNFLQKLLDLVLVAASGLGLAAALSLLLLC